MRENNKKKTKKVCVAVYHIHININNEKTFRIFLADTFMLKETVICSKQEEKNTNIVSCMILFALFDVSFMRKSVGKKNHV